MLPGIHLTLSNGVPIKTVSKLLGHTKMATTQIYARVHEKKVSEDMNVLRAIFLEEPDVLSSKTGSKYSSSAADFVSYLEKENEEIETWETEFFFKISLSQARIYLYINNN